MVLMWEKVGTFVDGMKSYVVLIIFFVADHAASKRTEQEFPAQHEHLRTWKQGARIWSRILFLSVF